MVLKCDCDNSSADMLYGKGFRPHSALVKYRDRPGPKIIVQSAHEGYCCDYCSYTRTRAQGRVTGAK